jgi:polysaccharide biosynthesis transport protein
MSLYQFFAILRARRGLAGLIVIGTIALALAWVMLRPHSFTARAPVLIDVRMDPISPNNTPLQAMVSTSFVSTQIDIVKSDRVAERAIKLLPADQPPMSKWREQAAKKPQPQAWLTREIQQRLEVKPARESNIINISWTGGSPAEAARVANSFAQAYLETVLEIKTDPAKKYADWFDDQVKVARQKLEQAQAKLSDFQQKSGILSVDDHGDFENARLKDLNTQLLATLNRGGSGGEVAASVANPLVSSMRGELARMEAKVQEASATLGSAHPRMQQMQAELAAMRSRVASESSRVGSVADSSAAATRARARELERAIAEQKSRILGVNKQRGELSVLQRDVDSLQKAYETVAASAAQSRLQSLTTQTNVMRLASAVEPLEPTGPSPVQALLAAGAAGAVLAIAIALLLELLNRRVRSADDLSSIAQVPILACVPAAPAGMRQLHLAAPRRLALAHGSAG